MAYSGNQRADLYGAIYQAIDASVALRRSLPVAQAKVQRALAQLGGPKGDPEAVRQLEKMSVHLHQLTAASMHPREEGRRAAVQQLSKLADQWMARLPIQ